MLLLAVYSFPPLCLFLPLLLQARTAFLPLLDVCGQLAPQGPAEVHADSHTDSPRCPILLILKFAFY